MQKQDEYHGPAPLHRSVRGAVQVGVHLQPVSVHKGGGVQPFCTHPPSKNCGTHPDPPPHKHAGGALGKQKPGALRGIRGFPAPPPCSDATSLCQSWSRLFGGFLGFLLGFLGVAFLVRGWVGGWVGGQAEEPGPFRTPRVTLSHGLTANQFGSTNSGKF